ncbi:serine O-acetyltransferase [Streptomyces sp. NRRL S-31]|uniref:serine O-acetyltransferase n=1 Tax=Streptomyces sp. NRRL S-31 TaxID=1463898 RepID=UPI0007C7BFE1|nr:serine O-acetyltransferase [Streptomyces sp. NRRL S-31]
MPGLLRLMREDLEAVLERDPSRTRLSEAALHAPWHGLVLYRVAHHLHLRGHRVGPGLLTWFGRLLSGMEIHASARLGRRVFIDHGFGVVIGQTCTVGDDVTIYHHVTLGSRGWWQDGGARAQRHPKIGNRVTIGVGASVLGPVTIGDDVRIRAHALVLNDIMSEDQ